MSLLDGFLENTEIFKGSENRIDQEAFNALVEEHGIGIAMGYMKALLEFTQVLNDILLVPREHVGYFPETHANTYGKVSNLHNALLKFIDGNSIQTDGLKKPYALHTRSKGF